MEIDGVKRISNAEEQYCLVVFFLATLPSAVKVWSPNHWTSRRVSLCGNI